MKKLSYFLFTVISVIVLASVTVPVAAESYSSDTVYIQDDNYHMSDDEVTAVASKAEAFSQKTGYNIGIVISDDIMGYSAETYSDDIYDDVFGINTNGVLILLNNDTYIDHISTSGDAILMYDDYRIEQIHEYAHSSLVKELFCQSLEEYIDRMDYYYDSGIPDSNEGYYVDTDSSTLARESDIMGSVVFSMIFAVATFLISFFSIKARYKFKSVPSATTYIDNKDTFLRDRSDIFLRQYTTSHRIESSSSGGGGGSSVHRSSSGGTHGGGSHHR